MKRASLLIDLLSSRARVHSLHVEVEAIRQRMERVDAALQELRRVERELETP